MSKTYKIFLQYLLEHQNPTDNYFNRYSILKRRLINEHSYKEKKIDSAKINLEKAGFIAISSNHMLSITNSGIEFIQHENQHAMQGWLEKFTQYFNKKFGAIVGIITLAIAIIDLYLNSQSSIIYIAVQLSSFKIINFF